MLLRRIARPLLAGIFIQGGIAALRDAKGHADVASPVLDKVTQYASNGQQLDNVTMVRIDAGVKIGAGALLALGKAPRLAAVALATSLVPTTMAGHAFWEVDDPQVRAGQRVHFVKNLGLLGGLLLASADTYGRPSLTWRARRARRTSAAAAEQLSGRATWAGERLADQSDRLRSEASALSARAAKRAQKASKRATKASKRVQKRASKQLRQATKRAKQIRS